MSEIDFLSFGDITIDAFIRLKEADVHCNIDRSRCEICLRFADKIPFESVEVISAVGNSANAAVAAVLLGLKSSLVSNVGDDQNGKECLGTLKKNGVSVDFVKIQKDRKTNYHYVLWYDDERTILVKHEPYDYVLPSSLPLARFAYLSSIGEGSENYHQEIAEFFKSNPEIKVTFQPGTLQINLGTERLKEIYEKTFVFACNIEEARRILKDESSPATGLLQKISALGPKIVLITDGPKGAYALNEGQAYSMPIYPDPKPPLERTGAGDAFASTFTSALALGRTFEEALLWAPINPMSVVQEVGAQKGLLTRERLTKYLAAAPADYKPKKL
ncbi:MAG: carbohydrate kinase family protein [Candidatus Taylorbacteria bacterium]|nr:carbohydrate kinase family protein [Candidatus Taylorbacteria bacterium]